MTEHVLTYDHSVSPQEKSWDCGPASTQVVLNGRGVVVSEDDLIPQEGTTENGTNDVDNIVPVLNKYLPEAGYQSVHMPDDPPTQAQKNLLWNHIVESINSGHGLVANIVAPPSNYPVGIKGSVSPSYGGGTVFHYIALMGYDDDPKLRAVWVADPGFTPFGYWVSFDQLATLIPPKGYAYSTAPAVEDPTPPPADDPAPPASEPPLASEAGDAPSTATPSQAPAPGAESVLAAATGLSLGRATELLPAVSAGLQAADCINVNRIAMFLAQCGEESAGFSTTEEFASGAEYEGRADLGNTVPGDGVRFKGRTWIQITGRHNYGLFSQWAYSKGLVDSADYFVANPTELSDEKWAGVGAAWYWTVARPQINSLCDNGDIVGVTQAINGGTNGLDERTRRWNLALAQGDALLQLLTPQEEDQFMPALTADEQRELLDLARQIAGYRRESRSPLRWPHQGEVDTCAGFAWNADAYGHVSQVEKLAVTYGDAQAIANLYAVATTDEDGRDADKVLASKILDRCDPIALNKANPQIIAWLDAEGKALAAS